jgi:glutathione-specific gamma-glutamylcyclotransferase
MSAPLFDSTADVTADPSRPLSREDLVTGGRRDAYIQKMLAGIAWSEAQLQQSLEQTLARAPAGDVWIFAYGSLIWNPLFPVAEERVAQVHGLHRSFCIWSRVGRGSPDKPGLVLGLNRGGTCRGVVLRLEQHLLREELSLIWRREMVTGAYCPTWIKARTSEGVVDAIAFVANRKNSSYAGRRHCWHPQHRCGLPRHVRRIPRADHGRTRSARHPRRRTATSCPSLRMHDVSARLRSMPCC